MADALGVAASVAGLVSLGLQTTEYLYKFYSAYKDRDEDLSKTTRRLGDLLQSLNVIDDVLQKRTWRPDEKTTLQSLENAIQQSEDVIQDLREEVKKLQKEPTTNVTTAMKTVGRRAAYPFRKGTLAKLDEDVGAFNENLNMALQALHLKEHQNTQRDIEEVRDLIKSVQAQHLTTGVRQWLKAPDATIEYNIACTKRHARTGQWLVQGPIFATWLQRDNSFLWLYGFAGCGKSVLCSTAVQYAFRQQCSVSGSATAFFFFTFNDESKRDASAFLRALLLQLSGPIPGVGAELQRLQDSYPNGTPPVPILMEYLRGAITRSSHVYILLDALDECPIATARQDVLTTIHTMRQWSLPGLHLLVTSRDLPDIRDHLHLHGPVNNEEFVALNSDNMQQDIQGYVAYQVDHDPHLRRWGDHREKIKEHLAQRAKGVFRWVECQLEPLRHCARSVKHLEKRLSALPQSLDETYERMLCEIDVDSRNEAQRMLALLCCSPRPLSVGEVIDALAVDIEENKGFDADRKFEGADDLLRICPGMVEIDYIASLDDNDSNGHEADSDLESGSDSLHNRRTRIQVVRIAHFSVQEYLLSDRIRGARAVDFAISDSHDHVRISYTCLLYLHNNEFLSQALTPDLLKRYPFAEFAAEYWYHYYEKGNSELAGPLLSLAIEFLMDSAMLDRWIMLHDPERPFKNYFGYGNSVEKRATATYYAASLGLDDVLAGILAISHDDINVQGGLHGNALRVASHKGHEKVVQVLLEKEADVNAVDEDLGTALCAASWCGHVKIVQMLLDNGADVDASKEDTTALCAASWSGHEKIVQILLDNGADVNKPDYYYGTALYAASKEGQEKVVQVLLDNGANINGANINAKWDFRSTALYAASRGGKEKIVRMLLDKGADVNIQGGLFGSALRVALHFHHEAVVQTLLQHMAKPEW